MSVDTTSLTLLPSSLKNGMLAPVSVPYIRQIDIYKVCVLDMNACTNPSQNKKKSEDKTIKKCKYENKMNAIP